MTTLIHSHIQKPVLKYSIDTTASDVNTIINKDEIKIPFDLVNYKDF